MRVNVRLSVIFRLIIGAKNKEACIMNLKRLYIQTIQQVIKQTDSYRIAVKQKKVLLAHRKLIKPEQNDLKNENSST